MPGCEAHRIGLHADEVVLDLKVLLAARSEPPLAQGKLRSEPYKLLTRTEHWLETKTALASRDW